MGALLNMRVWLGGGGVACHGLQASWQHPVALLRLCTPQKNIKPPPHTMRTPLNTSTQAHHLKLSWRHNAPVGQVAPTCLQPPCIFQLLLLVLLLRDCPPRGCLKGAWLVPAQPTHDPVQGGVLCTAVQAPSLVAVTMCLLGWHVHQL
jgi:hypothetical protein